MFYAPICYKKVIIRDERSGITNAIWRSDSPFCLSQCSFHLEAVLLLVNRQTTVSDRCAKTSPGISVTCKQAYGAMVSYSCDVERMKYQNRKMFDFTITVSNLKQSLRHFYVYLQAKQPLSSNGTKPCNMFMVQKYDVGFALCSSLFGICVSIRAVTGPTFIL